MTFLIKNVILYKMKKLEQFIDDNFNKFINLTDSEVCEVPRDEFSGDVIQYLKSVQRFDYRNICAYFVNRTNTVWIENMS